LARRDLARSKTTLQQAIGVSPENPTAHALPADAFLNRGDCKSALSQSNLAIDKGASKATNVPIVRGEALADMERDDAAIKALKGYLSSRPVLRRGVARAPVDSIPLNGDILAHALFLHENKARGLPAKDIGRVSRKGIPDPGLRLHQLE
jgi:hypothetical protein